jgi:hypothetical protein
MHVPHSLEEISHVVVRNGEKLLQMVQVWVCLNQIDTRAKMLILRRDSILRQTIPTVP